MESETLQVNIKTEAKRLKFFKGNENIVIFPNYEKRLDRYFTKAMYYAVLNDYENSKPLEALVNAGVDVNAYLGQYTPLQLSIVNVKSKITDALLKLGADANKCYRYWNVTEVSPLYMASWNSKDYNNHEGRLSIVKSLLQNGADVNLSNSNDETPIMMAVSSGYLGNLKEMLEWNADVNAVNNHAETCLHIACHFSPDFKIFLELFKWGACMDLKNLYDKTALDLILQSERAEKLENAKAFLKAAVLVNNGRTDFSLNEENDPLLEFMQECLEEVLRMTLISCGPNYTLSDFALRGVGTYTGRNCVNKKSIFDVALEALTSQTFPIYNDLIADNIERAYLIEKLTRMEVYAKLETGELFLYPDIIRHICSCLRNTDLLILLKASIKTIPPCEN